MSDPYVGQHQSVSITTHTDQRATFAGKTQIRGSIIMASWLVALASASAGVSSPALALGPVPSAVSAKLADTAKLGKLWSEPGARLPVIVEFAMPTLPDAASFPRPDDADAAQTNAIRAVQDAILSRLFSSPDEIARAETSTDRNLKRMSFSPLFALWNVTAGNDHKIKRSRQHGFRTERTRHHIQPRFPETIERPGS